MNSVSHSVDKKTFSSGKFPHKTHRQVGSSGQPDRRRHEKRAEQLEQRRRSFKRAILAHVLVAYSESLSDGLDVLATWLKEELACDEISIATWNANDIQLRAAVGCSAFDCDSESHQLHLRVHRESNLRGMKGIFVLGNHVAEHGNLDAHRQLAKTKNAEVVRSQPLTSSDGQPIGSIVMLGTREKMVNRNADELVAAVGPSMLQELLQNRNTDMTR